MVTDLQLIGLLMATIFGSLTSWYLGWKDVGGVFDFNKALPSIIRTIIAALIVFVPAYTGFVSEVVFFTYILAYLAGLGIDAGLNRAAGVISAKPTTTTPT